MKSGGQKDSWWTCQKVIMFAVWLTDIAEAQGDRLSVSGRTCPCPSGVSCPYFRHPKMIMKNKPAGMWCVVNETFRDIFLKIWSQFDGRWTWWRSDRASYWRMGVENCGWPSNNGAIPSIRQSRERENPCKYRTASGASQVHWGVYIDVCVQP